MASSSYAYALSLLLPLALTFLLTEPSHAARSDPSLVDKICKATPYPDLCIFTVNAGPPATDAKGIARNVVKAAADKNKDMLKYMLSQPPDQDPSFDLVVFVCTRSYKSSDVALRKAAEIGPSVTSDVKEATTDLAECRKTFESESGPLDLPKKQELLEHLLSVATKIFTFF